MKKSKLAQVISTRHQTKLMAETEIKSPKIAVKPNKNTAVCNST